MTDPRLRAIEWRDLLTLTPAEKAWELVLSLPWLAGSLVCYHQGAEVAGVVLVVAAAPEVRWPQVSPHPRPLSRPPRERGAATQSPACKFPPLPGRVAGGLGEGARG